MAVVYFTRNQQHHTTHHTMIAQALNQNSPAYKALTIASIERLGVANHYKAQPLCIQKLLMVHAAIRAGHFTEALFA